MNVATRELEALVRREHANPHSVLGVHEDNGGVVLRALRPAASGVKAQLGNGDAVELEEIHPGGVFEDHPELCPQARLLLVRERQPGQARDVVDVDLDRHARQCSRAPSGGIGRTNGERGRASG